ncbi:conserved oligomeric Golgi complex component [Dimargaris verticillata]|uniref:Conserved oligomeric Golgi complex subunit 8 n=1 Tax=Dimargaris verticillata TaxID=2761393 RepID=A0A9W8EF97_9FUNG|nr:conserved oligomeric Golgi complex component [Dimargaris verticillata]
MAHSSNKSSPSTPPSPTVDVLAVLNTPLSASVTDNQPTTEYVKSLIALSLATVRNEPTLLHEELESINQELMQLCLDESATFQHAHNYLEELDTGTQNMVQQCVDAQELVPAMQTACRAFTALAQTLEAEKRTVRVVVSNFDRLIGILELPQLMRSCVANHLYRDAIDLWQFVQRLVISQAAMAGHSPSSALQSESNCSVSVQALVHTIAQAVASEFETMIEAMVDELSQVPPHSTLLARAPLPESNLAAEALSPTSPPSNLLDIPRSATHHLLHQTKLLGQLRATQVFSDLELRALLLRAKQRAWHTTVDTLTSWLTPADQPYLFISRLLELARDFLVALSTQYPMMFTSAAPTLPILNILPGVLSDQRGLPAMGAFGTHPGSASSWAVPADSEAWETSSSSSGDSDDSLSLESHMAPSLSMWPRQETPQTCPLYSRLIAQVASRVVAQVSQLLPLINKPGTLTSLLEQLQALSVPLSRIGADITVLLIPSVESQLAQLPNHTT